MTNILIRNTVENTVLKPVIEQILARLLISKENSGEEKTRTHQFGIDEIDGGIRVSKIDSEDEKSILFDVNFPIKASHFAKKIQQSIKLVTVPQLEEIIKIQGLIFEPHQLQIRKQEGSDPIILTEKERDILVFLFTSEDHLASREALLRSIWRYVPDIETHTLETHMYRLRQKIENDPSNPKIVVTEEEGYRLVIK
ncbi:MAG: helix-turn-helix domain-containing protein [Pseudomonadota bacterium]